MPIHVHVYKVTEVFEVDVDTLDPIEARSMALACSRAAQPSEWHVADCTLLAVTPESIRSC